MIRLFLAAAIAVPAFAQPRPKITGVAHIAVYSKDLAQSRAFYRDFLGYRESQASARASIFQVNPRQAIEIYPEREPATDRLHHIALETDDVNAMREYLRDKGVATPERVDASAAGDLTFSVRDPEGHTVAFVQYRASSRRAREGARGAPVSSRILHVGIIVTQFDAVNRFYQDVLGFTETWRGGGNPAVLSWTNLRVPDGSDYIELMLYKEWPEPTRRGSAHHVALEVPDIDAAVAAIEKTEYRKQYTRPIEIRTGINRKRQVNLFDPDGTRSELMEARTIDGKPAPWSTAPPPSR